MNALSKDIELLSLTGLDALDDEDILIDLVDEEDLYFECSPEQSEGQWPFFLRPIVLTDVSYKLFMTLIGKNINTF